MTWKILQFTAIFAVGAVCGGLGVKRLDNSRETQVQFARRLKCQSLGAKYAEENTAGSFITSVDLIDYSRARNSCIAEKSQIMLNPNGNPFLSLDVVDVVSGQTIFVASCSQGDQSCQTNAKAARDKAFEKALRSAD